MTGLPEYLDGAVKHVLSSMCFAIPEFTGTGKIPDSIGSRINFEGEVKGELCVGIKVDVAKQLSADFLAVDVESIGSEQARFFVLELANILCGEMLASAAVLKRYNVSLPSRLNTAELEPFPYCFSIRGDGPDIGLDFRIENTADLCD